MLGTPVLTLHWGQVPGDEEEEERAPRGVFTCPACDALISLDDQGGQ